MSNYSRVEVNLLPPELLPPPALRIATILNAFIVVGTLAYIGIMVLTSLWSLNSAKEQIETTQAQIEARKPIVATYTQLTSLRDKVEGYGRIVSLASVDYVDIPLLLDRLAKIIPDRVYLASVSNDRPGEGEMNTIVQVNLVAADRDTALVEQTLQAFKRDPIFHDSYMRVVEAKEEALSTELANFGVDWIANGPDVPANLLADKYEFTILANVTKPIDTSALPVLQDDSVYLADVTFKTPPPPTEDEKKGRKSRKRDSAEPAAEPAAAPAPAAAAPAPAVPPPGTADGSTPPPAGAPGAAPPASPQGAGGGN